MSESIESLRAQILTAMGVGEEAQSAYEQLRADPAAEVDADLRDDLVAAHLISPMTNVPTSLRLAVASWSTQKQLVLDEVVEAANLAEAPVSPVREGFLEVITEIDAVVGTFDEIQRGARERIRIFDRPPYLSGVLNESQESVTNTGVHYQSIYLSSLLQHETLRHTVAEAIHLGEEARMNPDLPMRMMIVDDDRAMLILPQASAGNLVATAVDAVVVYPSALLNTLIRLFESTWAQSVPVHLGAAGQDNSDREILTLLSSGMTDASIARALGVSERTVARRINRLQERLGAPTRFLLGVRVGEQGLLEGRLRKP